MYELVFLEESIVRQKLLCRLNYKNSYDLPSLQSIKMNLLLSESSHSSDHKVIEMLDVLELITNQRSMVKSIKKKNYPVTLFTN